MAKKCRPNKEAKDWTREDLENLGCTVTDLGNSYIRRIPKDVLCGAINADDSALTNCLNEVDDIPAGRVSNPIHQELFVLRTWFNERHAFGSSTA